MLKKFISFIEANTLCSKDDKVLVTVSGGVDSVVLLSLFKDAGFFVKAAHCNFKLRGEESDEDELFVRDFCNKNSIDCHITSFETREYASQNKMSIEMAARKLRYDWFNSLCKEYDYTKIATGHHLNDSIETVFINLTRGTGINGVTGISAKNDKIIRPLLFATRTEIEQYAKENDITYRTDSSNKSNDYVRNRFRNTILPLIKEINPAFENTMRNNISHFKDVADIVNQVVNQVKKDLCTIKGGQLRIAANKLKELDKRVFYLHEIISEYGFSQDTVVKVIKAVESGDIGRLFYSQEYRLLTDREFILIERNEDVGIEYTINSIEEFSNLPVEMRAEIKDIEKFTLVKSEAVASIDVDLISYPLKVRTWRAGDYFYPLGMNGKKKLSNFFTDNKTDRFSKEKTLLLINREDIVWIVGKRLDNRYKVTSKTKKVLVLEVE